MELNFQCNNIATYLTKQQMLALTYRGDYIA